MERIIECGGVRVGEEGFEVRKSIPFGRINRVNYARCPWQVSQIINPTVAVVLKKCGFIVEKV